MTFKDNCLHSREAVWALVKYFLLFFVTLWPNQFLDKFLIKKKSLTLLNLTFYYFFLILSLVLSVVLFAMSKRF